MNCPSCGADNDASARFCVSCRKDLDKLRAKGELAPVAQYVDPAEEAYGRGFDAAYTARATLDVLGRFVGFVFATLGVIFGLTSFFFPSSRVALLAGAVGCFVLAVPCLYRGYRTREEILPTLAPVAQLSEFDDVQFILVTPTDPQLRAARFEVTLHLQNCVNRTRNVRFSLAAFPVTRTTDPNPPLRFHRVVEVKLGPGETARVDLPLVINPSPPPLIELWFSPSATGERGRRVRYARAREFEERVTDGETALAAIAGALVGSIVAVGGGGLRFRPRWWNDKPAGVDWDAPLPAPSVTVTDKPSTDRLIRASA